MRDRSISFKLFIFFTDGHEIIESDEIVLTNSNAKRESSLDYVKRFLIFIRTFAKNLNYRNINKD